MTTTASPASAIPLAIRRRHWTLALLTAVYLFSYMDRYILAILLELIKKDLRLSDTQLGILSGLAFAVFYATLGLPVARLADKGNRRNIITVSLALWSGMTALCGLAQNFTQLLGARIGVGVGEAGSGPPSHSIIADLYPPERRAGAMAIFSTGVVVGAAGGTILGGLVAASYGWRIAMMTVGLPGVALALLVRFAVIEPARGQADAGPGAASEPVPDAWTAFLAMWRSGPAFHLVMGVTLTSLIGYAVSQFGPAFLQRSLGMSLRQISLIVAPLAAIVGVISGVGGGKLADWAGARWGLHAQAWLVAGLKVLAFPCAIGFYLSHSVTAGITLYIFYLLFASSYLGPTFALIQTLAPLRMRAMWAAVTLLVINLIGLGLGPTLVGVISDLMKPHVGEQESLRYALLIVVAAAPWTIFHYWRAGVLLKRRDAAAAVA